MSTSLFLSILYITVCGYTVSVWCSPTPHYSIDLDLNPQERWKEVGEDYATLLKEFKQAILKEFRVSEHLIPIADKIGSDLERYIPVPFSGELAGLAKNSNMSLPEMTLLNLMYELSAFCTSIVVQNETGHILHGRNLDYNFVVQELKKLVIDVDFKRNGTTVYSGTTFAGYIGLLTAQKPGVVTVTLNERDRGMLVYNLIDLLLANYSIVSFAIREMLDRPYQTFESAVNYLAYETKLIAPCYIIMGGVNTLEGVVITRARIAAVNIERLDLAKGKWFVLETNYDSWNTPPSSDDRRDPAIGMLNQLGRGITVDTLYSVLNRKPVCNSGTTYTTVMSAADPALYSTHIRDNDCS